MSWLIGIIAFNLINKLLEKTDEFYRKKYQSNPTVVE